MLRRDAVDEIAHAGVNISAAILQKDGQDGPIDVGKQRREMIQCIGAACRSGGGGERGFLRVIIVLWLLWVWLLLLLLLLLLQLVGDTRRGWRLRLGGCEDVFLLQRPVDRWHVA